MSKLHRVQLVETPTQIGGLYLSEPAQVHHDLWFGDHYPTVNEIEEISHIQPERIGHSVVELMGNETRSKHYGYTDAPDGLVPFANFWSKSLPVDRKVGFGKISVWRRVGEITLPQIIASANGEN